MNQRTNDKTNKPLVKLISILILLFGILSIENISLLFLAFLIVFLYLIIIKIPQKLILKRIMLLIPFMGLMFIITPLQIKGKELFKINLKIFELIYSYEGFIIVSIILLKAMISMILVLVLTETTTKQDIFVAMRQIYIPTIIIRVIEFTLNYFLIIFEEFKRVIRAQKARGFKFGKSLFNIFTLKTIGYTIGHIFLKSLDRSEKIYKAMLSRGYKNESDIKKNTNIRIIDMLIITLFIMISILLIFIDKRWY